MHRAEGLAEVAKKLLYTARSGNTCLRVSRNVDSLAALSHVKLARSGELFLFTQAALAC